MSSGPVSNLFAKKRTVVTGTDATTEALEPKPSAAGFSFDFKMDGTGKKRNRKRGGKGKAKGASPKPKAEGDVEAAAAAIADASYGNLPPADGGDDKGGAKPNPKPKRSEKPATPSPSTMDTGKGDAYIPEGEWQSMDISGSGAKSKRRQWFEDMVRRVYGDLDMNELERIAMLSGMLFFIIGGYWLLRSCKDPIMTHIVGIEYIPKAKMLSLFVVLGAVYVYNILVDRYPKHQLFYIVGGFYVCLRFHCDDAIAPHHGHGQCGAAPHAGPRLD